MTLCRLCALPAVDDHGLCSRTSITHAALRTPDAYPRHLHPERWEAIDHSLDTGASVFPEPAVCAICTRDNARTDTERRPYV